MSRETSVLLRRLVVSVVLVAAFLVGGASLFRALAGMREEPTATEREKPGTLVRTRRITRSTWTEELTGYGRAVALKRTAVSAEVPGIVIEVSDSIRAGTRVDATSILIKLDGKDQAEARKAADAQLAREESRLLQARAALATAQKRVTKAEEESRAAAGELERVRELAQTSSSSRSEVDAQVMTVARISRLVIELEQAVTSARHEIAQAASAVAAAKAQQAKAIEDEARATIRAPWPGVVSARHVEVGARVTPGTALFDLIAPERVEVAIRLGASHYGEVAVGAPVTLRLREDGPVAWSGPVSRIAPEVDDGDRTFLVYCDVDADEARAPVPPGAFVVATVRGKSWPDVVPVPRMAFVGDDVFVVKTPTAGAVGDTDAVHALEKRRPVIFRLLPDVALVESGIAPGEQVVVTNLDLITVDSKVRIATSDEAAVGGNGGQR